MTKGVEMAFLKAHKFRKGSYYDNMNNYQGFWLTNSEFSRAANYCAEIDKPAPWSSATFNSRQKPGYDCLLDTGATRLDVNRRFLTSAGLTEDT